MMLQAPTNDRKTQTKPHSPASPKTAEQLPEQQNNLAALQKIYGNQAVLRMIRRSPVANPVQGVLQRKCACGNTAGLSGSCAECQSKQEGILQTKLQIGEAGDRYEQEADRVAEKIMTMPDPATAQSMQRGIAPEKEEYIQTKSLATSITPMLGKGTDFVQSKSRPQGLETGSSFDAGHPLENRLNNSGSGSPLSHDVRAFMELRFGVDFSQVRVHTGSEAVQMNQDLNAQAFTHQQDVYFGVGKAPAKDTLTAHELTHVVQQAAGVAPSFQRQPDAQSDDLDQVETGDMEGDDPIDDYETGADNEVAPEEDTNTNEDVSLVEEAEPLAAGKPTSGKWILVKLPGTLIRFQGDKRISSWGISGGKPTHPTPKGSFSINLRDKDHTSSSYGKCGPRRVGPGGASKCKKGEKYVGADMHFFQRFAPSVGFHRGDPGVQSHGCIHVNSSNAETLWNWSAIGTLVIVCEGSECDPLLGASSKKKKKKS